MLSQLEVQFLKKSHHNFNIQFIRSLILLGKFEKSFTYAKNLEEENANFDEANIILGINYFINND